MTQIQSDKKITIRNNIILILSIIGLIVCFAVLLPQVRQMLLNWAVQILHREPFSSQMWLRALQGYALGGICLILFFDYCTLTKSGNALVQKVKEEIKDCLSEIDFRSFLKPVLIMSGVYFLGSLTIMRADFLYYDDLKRAIEGFRRWYDWSRYVPEFSSILVHGDTNLTDISPLPQLLAILILSCSSVLLVYVIGKKITVTRLLASIPLGLTPYFLGCLSYKFDAPYMALSILTSIIPFLFIARKKAFIFFSVAALLIMCMTYQAASGIYPMIVVMLCFLDWNIRKKPLKEILSFLGAAAFAFCFAMLSFRFFLMKPDIPTDYYASTAMHPLSHLIQGTLNNIKNYAITVNHDLGMIWKIGILLVLLFFIIKSSVQSVQKRLPAFFVSISVIGVSFILSYGAYSLLIIPLYLPRALMGFGVFLAVFCIPVVLDYKKIATITVLALNWCFFVFAFSYGNALADQARYAEFRITILLNDLNVLFPNRNGENMPIRLKNSIDYTPLVKNAAKHYPLIESLISRQLGGDTYWDDYYFRGYFNYYHRAENGTVDDVLDNRGSDFNSLNLPVVLDSYYHTIQSDENHILVTLKH